MSISFYFISNGQNLIILFKKIDTKKQAINKNLYLLYRLKCLKVNSFKKKILRNKKYIYDNG